MPTIQEPTEAGSSNTTSKLPSIPPNPSSSSSSRHSRPNRHTSSNVSHDPVIVLGALQPAQLNSFFLDIIKPFVQQHAIVCNHNQRQLGAQMTRIREVVALLSREVLFNSKCLATFLRLHQRQIKHVQKHGVVTLKLPKFRDVIPSRGNTGPELHELGITIPSSRKQSVSSPTVGAVPATSDVCSQELNKETPHNGVLACYYPKITHVVLENAAVARRRYQAQQARQSKPTTKPITPILKPNTNSPDSTQVPPQSLQPPHTTPQPPSSHSSELSSTQTPSPITIGLFSSLPAPTATIAKPPRTMTELRELQSICNYDQLKTHFQNKHNAFDVQVPNLQDLIDDYNELAMQVDQIAINILTLQHVLGIE